VHVLCVDPSVLFPQVSKLLRHPSDLAALVSLSENYHLSSLPLSLYAPRTSFFSSEQFHLVPEGCVRTYKQWPGPNRAFHPRLKLVG
jgi:hypothetical protein